jgi:cell division protein FtsX
VNDLDTRLERLAAEAIRDAVPPELETVVRRGRRRRRRQLAGSALVVAAVVAAGLVLPSRLSGRPGHDAIPATAPAIDVQGAATLGGYWFGKTDATVFLRERVTPAQRDAVRRRLEALDVVDKVYFQSRADTYARAKELYRAKPGVVEKAFPLFVPESFHVRLAAPEDFTRLYRALCPGPPTNALGDSGCMPGIEAVIEDTAPLRSLLVPKAWTAISDVTVFLSAGATEAQRQAVRARLEAIDGVAKVTYESPEEAYRRLPEKLRRNGRDPSKVTPPLSPGSVPGAFHVTLDGPTRAHEFHLALCGSRKTGACAGGLVVLEHTRR